MEIKNFAGIVTFDTGIKQFTRGDGGKEVGYRYPITQAEFQQLKLGRWLHAQGFPNIPIHPLIAISKSSTIIEVIGDAQEIATKVHHAEYLPKKIIDLKTEQTGQNTIPHEKIEKLLLRSSSAHEVDLLQEHSLRFSDLLPGVCCPYCGMLGMVRGHNTWNCTRCQKKDKNAHLAALTDYFFLVGPYITNSIAQHLLNHPEKSSITRMLRGARLHYDRCFRRWWKKR
ncbi:hypothetical protein BME96_16185 [Virgibacillus halodenitrificans]|uniref:NERD domain-containing protein n=1 Tax=Virgibacillus halodenitrificans TaxID=1482 RepID=A0AAC9J2B3_VIRHA|nr:nuclease-related domain-containing protein [Virgibacillus halodenitrificans]APC49635.1 hypothetical protein BME96_16185 [Virgibacillus halodenitrificans]